MKIFLLQLTLISSQNLMKKLLSFYNKFWLNLCWALEPCIKGTWEGRLQNGDEIHIRFQLTTWKCILQSCSILPTPAAHKGIPLFFLRKEIEFLLAHLFVVLKNCGENWRELSSSNLSSRSNELRFVFSFHPRQPCFHEAQNI